MAAGLGSAVFSFANSAAGILGFERRSADVSVFDTGTTVLAETPDTVERSGAEQETTACVSVPAGAISWWAAENAPIDRLGINHATLFGDTGFVAGQVGQAFNLDGNGDYLQKSNPSALPLGNAPRTVELWFRTPVDLTSQTESGIFQYGSESAGAMFGLVTSSNAPGKLYFYGHSADLPGATTIAPNIWYHGAVTYDGTVVRLYVNGNLENSQAIDLNTVFNANGLTIGYRPGGSSWTGQIDEPTIYGRALSGTEIADIFAAGNAGKCSSCTPLPSGLVSWWPGNGSATDVQGPTYETGSLVNGTTYIYGLADQAFALDGANDYVNFGSSSAHDLADFTIDVWVLTDPATNTGERRVISRDDWTVEGGDGREYFFIKSSSASNCGASNRPQFGINAGSASSICSPYDLTPGWHHLAAVRQADTLSLFVDGELVANTASAGTGIISPEVPLVLGSISPIQNIENFSGAADEIGIFNRALSLTEIRSIYSSGSAGKCRSCTVRPSGVNSWWRSENNAFDSVGGNDGTLMNGATFAAGKVGRAFSFDGINDFVEVQDSPDLSFAPTAPMTVHMWAYPTTLSSVHFIGKRGSCLDGGQSANFQLAIDGPTSLALNVGGQSLYSNRSLVINRWQFIAATSTGSTLRIYIDGEEVGSAAGTLGPETTAPLVIGGVCSGVGATFGGLLDEVTIVGRALSGTEIAALYAADAEGVCVSRTASKNRADFDGDGRTDISIFRPSEGNWYLNRSTIGFGVVGWGLETDTLVPADYDGDGKTDVAVFRPTANESQPDYFVLGSNGSVVSGVSWGTTGDVPVSGDYDGDGKADFALFRPSTGVWYIINSGSGLATIEPFGLTGDIPLAIDQDGDGKTNLAVFRPGSNFWYMAKSAGVPSENFDSLPFGLAGDVQLPADYDGDGKDDVAVFRPGTGLWYILESSTGSVRYVQWGTSGDVPVPGDYDGDGRDDVCIYRNGEWWLNASTSGTSVRTFGLAEDRPVPAAYHP